MLVCAKDGGWGPRLTLHLHCPDVPTKGGWPPCGAPAQSTVEEATCPFIYPEVYSPKSSVSLCLWVFSLLIFRFFFKQSIFLGMITLRGPVGCVYVLNAPHSHVGTRAQLRGSSSARPREEGGPPAACQGQARLQGVLFLPRPGWHLFHPCPIQLTLGKQEQMLGASWGRLSRGPKGAHLSCSEGCPGEGRTD